MGGGFDIMNLVTFPNKSFHRVKIGRVNPDASEGQEFTIHGNMIVWQTIFNEVSISVSLAITTLFKYLVHRMISVIITTTINITILSCFYVLFAQTHRSQPVFKP